MTDINIDFTDTRTAVISAKNIPEEDWNKLYNLTYAGNCIKGYLISTSDHVDYPECCLGIEGYWKPYGVRVDLNNIYTEDKINRNMDTEMHGYIQWLGFSERFADIIIYFRKKQYDNLVIDRDA